MVPPPETPPEGSARRRRADGVEDLLVREEPLLLQFAGRDLLTMRTPGADEDLALGFLLSEGLISSADKVTGFRFERGDPEALRADVLQIELASDLRHEVQSRLNRTHEIRSSCGVCGMTDADAILEELPPLLPGTVRVTKAQVKEAVARARALQPTFLATGACHGAVLFAEDLDVLGQGEDVGRHNALDKALGQVARAGHDPARSFAVLSGRAGYDLVVKCLRLRVPLIAAVGAPSVLGHDLCHAAGATLLGFAGRDEPAVHCDGGHLLP